MRCCPRPLSGPRKSFRCTAAPGVGSAPSEVDVSLAVVGFVLELMFDLECV